ncbi:MAG TPA: hypothetical protein VFV23_12200 [Verrucomicrobiae bacterium]|nr:hypothetical protein [Verrucomicrobiae bacterium]
MKTHHLKPLLFLCVLGLLSRADAVVLMTDNFDSNMLDTGMWDTNTSLSDIYGTPMVVVANQRCEITARGYLNTVTNYDPAVLGGLMITGTWTFVNDSGGGGDLPWVVTRSSGAPSGYYAAAGEVTQGVNFRVAVSQTSTSPNLFTIVGDGPATVTGLNVVSNTLDLVQGDSATFTITDDGTNLTFSMVKVGDSSQTAYATAVCTNHFAVNKVSFYNREYAGDTAAVDNVTIQTITSHPQLTIAPAGNLSVLFWPASATNYVLESVTNLTSTNWTAVTDAVPVIAVTVSNMSPARFFRLQAQ